MGRAAYRVWLLALLVLGGFGCIGQVSVWAANRAPVVSVESEEIMSHYTFRPGTIFLCLAETPVHTADNQLNDPVEARLVHDVYVGERTVIRAAARFWGRITVLEPPIEGRDAILGIRLETLELPNGEQIPLQGYVDTGNSRHVWGGGLTEGTKPRTVQFRVMGIGEYNKVVMEGPRQMGRHYKVDPGEYWRVVLESPLTVPIVNRRRFTP